MTPHTLALCLALAVTACGGGGDTDSKRESPCCKVCSADSKPCGDTCISKKDQCHKSSGCACSAGCCKLCTSGKPCGDTCISESDTCHQKSGCACSP